MYTRAVYYLALAPIVRGHMSLWYPGPLGGTKEANPASNNIDIDPELNFPLGCCDAQGRPTIPSPGVCRGHLDLYDTQDAQVTWQPGQDAYFQLSDYTYSPEAPGGTHDGGSCQIGFSVDRGETWKVAASYNGNCPRRGESGSPESQRFDFKVPIGIPKGKALFAWVWLNREHESFMNCAVVQIGDVPKPSTTLISTERSLESKETGDHWSKCSASRNSEKHQKTEHRNTDNDDNVFEFGETDDERDHELESSCSLKSGIIPVHEQHRGVQRSRPGKRVEACSWDSAPSMIISYFTIDADCAPDAKMRVPQSDLFEIGWDEPCGNVEGDGEFPIESMQCDRFD